MGHERVGVIAPDGGCLDIRSHADAMRGVSFEERRQGRRVEHIPATDRRNRPRYHEEVTWST